MESTPKLSHSFGIRLCIVILVVILASVVVLAIDFVLLIFLAMLFGVFLTKSAGLLSAFSKLKYGLSLGLVVTTLIVATVGGLFLFGVKIESRLDEMSDNLDKNVAQLDSWIADHSLARAAIEKIPFATDLLNHQLDGDSFVAAKRLEELQERESNETGDGDADGVDPTTNESSGPSVEAARSVASRVLSVFGRMMGTTLGLVANLGVIFFMGLFFAVDPNLYRDGFARLFPTARRDRVKEVLDGMADALFAWLNGRFLAMLVTGTGTGLALLLLDVPMAITIGIITALLTFVPNIGGLISFLLAVLMALTQGPITVVWVAVIYGSLQLIESNIVTPLIQQRQTSIPPALLLGFQIIMGALTGFLGMLVATPLLAAAIVAIKEVWVKDVVEAQSD